MEQDHLPCSCDQEVFERVWRRVMPEDRPDCPFTLGEDAAAPSGHPAPAAASACRGTYCSSGRTGLPGPWWEKSRRTLPGAPSAVYGPSSSGSLTGNWRIEGLSGPYPAGPRGNSGRVLATIAADERRHAKRPSTALFSSSPGAVLAGGPGTQSIPRPFSAAPAGALHGGAAGAAAYQTAGRRETADPCLHELPFELAGRRTPHAWLLRSVLEQLKNTPAHGFARAGGPA